jgi:8-amino-7-oxononanoate synthase
MDPAMSQDFYARQLDDLAQRDLRRRLHQVDSAQDARIVRNGRQLICFSSNNYLGLANDPRLIAAAKAALDEFGLGSGASRLITGSMTPHHRLEEKLAHFKQCEAALTFATGYQANLAAVSAGAARGDAIFSDALNHASIIDAARLSRADVFVFPHKAYDALESRLQRETQFARRLIVTDTVFSVDGDLADLPRLVELKTRYDAQLCIDEAHATGVFGPHGRGVAELQNVEDAIDITVGTLSKALGCAGGYVCGSRHLIDYLINRARSLIFSTAPPPAIAAAACAALDLIVAEPDRRKTLLAHADRLRAELGDRLGFNLGQSTSPIIPLIVGDSAAALDLSAQLLEHGLLVPAIRPPTVPESSSRLRITPIAAHTEADLDALISALETHQTA